MPSGFISLRREKNGMHKKGEHLRAITFVYKYMLIFRKVVSVPSSLRAKVCAFFAVE